MVSFQAVYLVSLLVFIVVVQSRNSDDTKRSKGFRLIDEQNSNRFRNYVTQIQNKSSAQSASTRATRHRCIASCFAEYTFSSTLTLPIDCSARVQAYVCYMEILVWYDLREYKLLFFSSSSDVDPGNTPYTSATSQIVSLRYGSSLTKFSSIQYACLEGDDCDWNYVRKVVNRMISANYEPLRNNLSPSLYTNAGNSATRCYQQSNPVSCSGGICTLAFDMTSSWGRNCSYLSDPVVGIDITNTRVFPDSPAFSEDSAAYACNRDLCNSPSVESTIKSTLLEYSSLFESVFSNARTSFRAWESTMKLILAMVMIFSIQAFV